MAEEDEADALSALEEVVRVFREPAVLSPDAHLANEAMALNTLADDLHTGGRLAEAVATAQEAVGILRYLVTTNRAAYLGDLAAVVTNLAKLCFEDADLAQARPSRPKRRATSASLPEPISAFTTTVSSKPSNSSRISPRRAVGRRGRALWRRPHS